MGLAGFALMLSGSGCRARRIMYVSAPPPQPVHVVEQPFVVATNAPVQTVIVTQQPPPAQVEVVTVSPGPAYQWAPGYWSWNGAWVWVGGGWIQAPSARRLGRRTVGSPWTWPRLDRWTVALKPGQDGKPVIRDSRSACFRSG